MTEPAETETGFDARAEAKRLLRTIRSGTLATLQPDGAPFASLVSVATAIEGHPLLLVSALSAHTRQMEAEPRMSLLLAQAGRGDPLARPRLTLTGRADRIVDPDERAMARSRFLSRQPKAKLYADFPDFSFWRLTPSAAHLNGGFARAASFAGQDLLVDAQGFTAMERSAVAHMNADHADALALYGRVLARAGAGAWTASGLDPEGIDLVCGDRVARIAFDTPLTGADGVRAALVDLAKRARAADVATTAAAS